MTSRPPGMPWQDSWYGLQPPARRIPLSGRLDHKAMLRRFQDLCAQKRSRRLDFSLLMFSLVEKIAVSGPKFRLLDDFAEDLPYAVAEHRFVQDLLIGAIGLEDFAHAVLFVGNLVKNGPLAKPPQRGSMVARGEMVASTLHWVESRDGAARLVVDLYSHDSIASCTAKRIDAPPGDTYGVVALTHQYLAVEAP